MANRGAKPLARQSTRALCLLFIAALLAGFPPAAAAPPLRALASAASGSADDVLGQFLNADLSQPDFTHGGADDLPDSQSLARPEGVAVDTVNHRLFVADTNNHRVLVFDLTAANALADRRADKVLDQADLEGGSANRGGSRAANTLNTPTGLAYDSTNNRLFVADSSNNRVLVYDVASITDGENAVNVLGQADFISGSANRGGSVAANTLRNPAGMFYDAAGNCLFVADNYNHWVLVYDVAAITDGEASVAVLGQANFTSGSANRGGSVAANTLNNPLGLAYDSTNNRLLVADISNHRVLVYDVAAITNGEAAVAVLGQANFTSGSANRGGSVAANTLYNPMSMAQDLSNNRLFVSDTANNRVLVYDLAAISDGEYALGLLGQGDFTSGSANRNGSVAANTLAEPRGLTYDTTSNLLYVADIINNRVLLFNAAPPSAGAMAINGGASYATSINATLTLTLTATGVTQALVSESASFTGASYQAYATTLPFTLSAGDGAKAVYALYWDSALGVSAAVSDTIIMDATPPAAFALSSPATGATTTPTPTFAWEAPSDATSGLAKYQLYVDGALNRDNISPSAPSTTPASALAEGAHTWKVVAVDNAGNTRDSSATWSLNVALATAAPWPETFVPYTYSDGSPILDPARDVNPSYTDISSGVDDGVGTLPSVYTASDGTNFFFRFRVRGDPAKPSAGGFESTAYSVAIGVNGVQVATVGLDGKSPSTDYVYVANADGSSVEQLYATPFSGASAGARTLSDGAGAYFLDVQVPISRVTAAAPSVTASTPVQLFFGTSQAANLSVINKDYVPGSSVSFSGLAVTRLQGLTSSTTSLSSSPNPSNSGQSVTFTATVTSTGGTPTGGVTFKDGTTTLGTAALSGGAATFSTSALSVGAHSIIAEYGGDSSFNSSTSSALSQTVNKANSSTALASSPNPSALGQTVTFTATVSSAVGTPTGNVAFKEGATTLATVAFSGGAASFSTSGLAVGSHSITAEYAGDSNFNGSTSSALSHVVNKADTSTTLSSSPNPSALGQTVAFTATVTSSGGAPTGSVTFKEGATTLSTAALYGGRASFITSTLSVGSHSITAEYGGDSSFNASASSALSQVVGVAAPGLSLRTGSRLARGPNHPQVDATSEYILRLSVSNLGSGPLANLTVSDTAPTGVTVVEVKPPLSLSGQTVIWSVGTLAAVAGAYREFRVIVRPTQAQLGQNIPLDLGATASGVNPDTGGVITATATAVSVGPVALPKGTLAGVVTDAATANPVAQAAVQVYDSSNNLAAQATTGSDGAYAIANLPSGSYKVTFAKPNHLSKSAKVEVTGGQTTTSAAALVPLIGSLTGMVASASSGQGIAGATVEVRNADGSFVQTDVTNSAGRYSFGNMAAGVTLTVTASHRDYDAGAGSTATAQPKWQGVSTTARAYTADLVLYPKKGSISGLATDSTTRAALAGVRATAYDAQDNLVARATTASDGSYVLAGLQEGSYTVRFVRDPDYQPASASAVVLPNRATGLDPSLTPRPGSIAGAVWGGEERLSGATVRLLDSLGTELSSTETNSAGEYQFQAVASGTYTVTASAPYYDETAGSSAGLTLAAGGTVQATLHLKPNTGSIAGTVADAQTGAALAGAAIQVYDGQSNLVARATAESDGAYSLARLPAGSYNLLATRPNYREVPAAATVLAGQALQVSTLLPPLPGSVSGLVADSATLVALTGAAVDLLDAGGVAQATGHSAEGGGYALGGIAPGTYTAAAEHPDYKTGSQGAAALTLGPGGRAERDLRLEPKDSVITGRIASSTTGEAVASARIMAYDANGNLASTVTTDASGAYTITNLAQGAYTLSVDGSAAGYLLSTASLKMGPNRTVAQDLALAPRAGSLSGALTDAATGQPIPGATVVLTYPNGATASARTNAGGEYAFTEVTAQVAVTVVALAIPPFYLQTVDSTATGTVPAGGSATANLRLQPGPGSIAGVAASALGPVSGATLQLYDAKGNLVAQATTGSDGTYSLSGLPPGAYTLTFSKAGWLSSSYSAKVEPGATASLDLAPTPLAGSISGTVKTSSTLRPLARAAIGLEDSAGSILATTLSDATGKYAFAGVTPGAYRVTAGRPDYQTGSKGTATGILYPEGSLALNLSLDPRPAAITGRVASSSTGQPIPGAILRVYQANGDLLATTTADATGVYTITGIPESAEPYTLEWTSPSYLPAANRVAISSGQRAVQNTALAPVEGSLSGKVTDAITGKAIQGATVEVRNSSGDILATSKTDRSGRYLVVGLPSQASLSVSATAPNYRTIASSSATVPFVLSSSVSPAQRRAGALSGRADLQLQPNPGSITGKATDSQTGAPLPGATVQLYDANNNLVATATSDATGAYTFSEVTVGDYTISVTGSSYLAASQAISVDPGQAGAKDVPLPPQAGSISGTVTEATTGKPLSGATVVLTDPASQARSTTSQANGAFAFAGVSVGTSVVGASHPDYTTGSGSATNMILLSGQAAKADLSLYPRPATISGTILDPATGQPVAGATVKVLDAAGNVLGTYTTDEQGRYFIYNLIPGSYTISFSRSGYLDSSSSLVVSPNQIVDARVVPVLAAQSISGAVTNSSTGQAIAGARVELLDGSGSLASAALTGGTGRYVFASVNAGSYTLRASHVEYDSGSGASGAVTLAAGQAATRDLRLDPKKGTIQVTVLDQATGQPLAGATVAISNTQGLIATLSTDSQGQAAKDGLPAGTYQVTASRSGLASRSAAATVEPNRKVLASLRLGYLVRATVLETETNQPVVGATVLLATAGGAQAGASTTRSGGVLQLDVTATGTYTISASAPEFDQVGQSTASVTVSAGSPSVSATLYLARQKTPHLTLAMARFSPRVLPFEVRGMAAGEPIYYGISYGNYGTTRATGVAITETLPLSTTFLGPAGWTRVDARTYTYNVGILGIGERGTVQFVVAREPALAPASAITNTVTIGDDGRNGRDLRPASAVVDVFRLQAIYLPLVQKSWSGGW